jgi:hypothetical protein
MISSSVETFFQSIGNITNRGTVIVFGQVDREIFVRVWFIFRTTVVAKQLKLAIT